MARVLVHALAATAGGGVTYLRSLLSEIHANPAGHEWVILLPPGKPLVQRPEGPISWMTSERPVRGIRRILFDQVEIPRIVRQWGIDVVLATGNFGLMRPRVPQVLLNRNALYFSREHIRQLRRRNEFREILNTILRRKLAVRSILASAVNVTPTQAFADEIRSWMGRQDLPIECIPFGFDHDRFHQPLSADSQRLWKNRLCNEPGVRRVLMVSHYNYFRNFDTLLTACAHLKRSLSEPIELVLTTRLAAGRREHRYDTSRSAKWLDKLGIRDRVTMLGPVDHSDLASLYATADVVVCPSYAESFGHPMVEAMACGRPVVAADRSVHREVCGPAALYFSTFDAEQLAFRIAQVLDDPGLAAGLGEVGRERSKMFTWQRHYAGIKTAIQRAMAKETVDAE